MAVRLSSGQWKALLRGVVLAYGISFVSGLIFFVAGLTPQTDQTLYPLLAFLSGALGVAIALRVMGTAGLFHLVMLGLGLWLINFSNVLLGTQTISGWLESSAFLAATVIGGRLLVGNSLVPIPATVGSSTVPQNP
ncbi:MAG: hypothetical protein MRJ68_20100 [Nitrospira sp.]|jgi:hypothetical protein|nr:hypothetical protein [Nitrospira sp.]